ncbi:MAG: hypothetical protein NTX96_00060, partial [Candidatus Zambryskibacteria bacterium]|nr:hypothetical protein [Candidatus Zambryskibacteria bacterium]
MVTATATASNGSTFAGWRGACDGSNSVQVLMDSNKTCIATFNLIPPPPPAPTVVLTANPTSVSYNGSSTLTWSSTNATSCTASGDWSGTKAISGSESTGNLTSGKTYTITCIGLGGTVTAFTSVTVGSIPPITYTLTINTTGNGSGTVTGAGTYNSGTTITAGATANSGSTFTGWSGDCNSGGQVTMNNNKTCVATFILIVAPISNLSISKTSDKTTASVGDTVTYTITLTNNGPDNATGVIVTDILNAGLN